MYFPSDMNFQYFFFDTYIGYFLQALPISLIVSVLYGIIKVRLCSTLWLIIIKVWYNRSKSKK